MAFWFGRYNIILHILKTIAGDKTNEVAVWKPKEIAFFSLASEATKPENVSESEKMSPASLCGSGYGFLQLILVTCSWLHSRYDSSFLWKEQDHEADHRPVRTLQLISDSDLTSGVDITPHTCC